MDGPSRLMPADVEEPPRFAPGTQLGGSRSGEVWQARDSQTGETVAYKLVAPQALPTPAVFERAQRELKQLQRSQSPRIARVIDRGKAADGRLFIAMELCSGESLEQLVARTGAIPLDRAKKIIAQIGEALLEGQKVGVVHHDLAPKNILVDGHDQVKVINFSVAAPATDRVFGVPEFLSPEQAEGKPGDQRSNTYSLGAIAVFLLTGTPPFSGPSAEAVLEQVVRGEVTPPSSRTAELTPEIDRILLRAMDKSSSRRPLTLRQFLSEVAAMHLGGAPAPTRSAPAFNKTIAYSGGAPEVRRLVAEAHAARVETNGSGPAVAYSPVTAAPAATAAAAAAPLDAGAPPPPPVRAAPGPAQQPTPPPVAHRNHGAAIAATMMAMPAAAPSAPLGVPIPGRAPAAAPTPAPVAFDPHNQPTPPPVLGRPAQDPAPSAAQKPAVAHAAASAQQGQPQGQGANFRETLWFKKGDVEQMVAEAKAKAAVLPANANANANASRNANPNKGRAETPSGGHELPAEDGKPLEDRYLDDGSVTVEDRKKFSLRSGGTSAAVPAVGGEIPGDRMSEAEMLNEIGGGKKTMVIVAAVVGVAALVLVLFLVLRGKGSEKPAASPSSATTVTKPGDPTDMPAAANPPQMTGQLPGKAGGSPAAAATPTDDGDAPHAKEAAPAKDAPATAKARSAKKKPAKRTQGKKKR